MARPRTAETLNPEAVLVGSRLRTAREAASLTQAEAARRANMAQARLARLERGQRHLRYLEADRLARIYGLGLAAFLPEPSS